MVTGILSPYVGGKLASSWWYRRDPLEKRAYAEQQTLGAMMHADDIVFPDSPYGRRTIWSAEDKLLMAEEFMDRTGVKAEFVSAELEEGASERFEAIRFSDSAGSLGSIVMAGKGDVIDIVQYEDEQRLPALKPCVLQPAIEVLRDEQHSTMYGLAVTSLGVEKIVF